MNSHASRTPGHRAVKLGPIVAEVLESLRPTLPSGVQLVSSQGERRCAVAGHAPDLARLLLELCRYACRCSRTPPKRLTVTLDLTRVESEIPGHHPALRRGVYVRAGISIDPKDGPTPPRSSAQPLQSPAQDGPAEQCLTAARQIAQTHRGSIALHSGRTRGLAAELLLPASQLSRATRRATIELPLRGDETILLVDDEEALVRISQRMLQRLGYTVVPMSCPLEADAYLQKNPKSIDLLLTDLMMPRLSGVDLAERAAVHVPGLPILLTTGRTDSQLDAEGEPSAFYAVITKPYARLDLASAVRKALDASARGGRRLHGPPLPSAVSTKSGAP